MQALNCTFYSWQKGMANCTDSAFRFRPKLFYGPEINLWISHSIFGPPVHMQQCQWRKSACLCSKLHQLYILLPAGPHASLMPFSSVSSLKVLTITFLQMCSEGSSSLVTVLVKVASSPVLRPTSSTSSNALPATFLQMGVFFKCSSSSNAFFFKRSSSSNAPFFRCSSTSNAPFFKCVPSSNALRLGQLNHWGWQYKLHYHGPRNSGRRWLHPLEMKTRESEPGPEYLKWYSYGNSENNSSLKLPPLMWVGNVTSWWNLVLARYLLISFSSFFAQ